MAETHAGPGPATTESVVHLDGVSVIYGKNQALKNVSARFAPGAVGLLGPNGAGKSTMLKSLLGFVKPTAGRMTVLGLDATPEVKADFEKRRAMANKLLRLDPFALRHKLPRSAFVWLHATGRRVAYRFTNTEQVGGQSGITDEEFFITEDIDPSTLVLLAIAGDPIR